MGTDYVPFDVVNEDGLLELIQIQSTSFKSMPYFWSTMGELDTEISENLVSLHKATCHDASKRIQKRIKLYNDETRRVYFISHNYALPPCIRFDALSSYMPSRLPKQVQLWHQWVSEMRKKEYAPYLKELFIYHNSRTLKQKIHELQEAVRAFQERYPGRLDKELLLQILLLNTNFQQFVVGEIDAPKWFQTNHSSTVQVRLEAYLKYYNLVRYCLYSYVRKASNKWKIH